MTADSEGLPLLPWLCMVMANPRPCRRKAAAEFTGQPQGGPCMSASHPHDPKADFLAQRGVLHLHPERVQDALFHGRAFFDARDLVQVRYEMVRRYRVDGQKATGVARSFGVS